MSKNLTEAFARNISRKNLRESTIIFEEHAAEIISSIDGVTYKDGKIWPDYISDKYVNYIKEVYGVYDSINESIIWHLSLRGNICDKLANETRFYIVSDLVNSVNTVLEDVEECLQDVGMEISHSIMSLEDSLDGI